MMWSYQNKDFIVNYFFITIRQIIYHLRSATKSLIVSTSATRIFPCESNYGYSNFREVGKMLVLVDFWLMARRRRAVVGLEQL